jgi:hypothetical protein
MRKNLRKADDEDVDDDEEKIFLPHRLSLDRVCV